MRWRRATLRGQRATDHGSSWAVTVRRDCDDETSIAGIPKMCVLHDESALCVDASLTPCAKDDPEGGFCNAEGDVAYCRATDHGYLVRSLRCGDGPPGTVTLAGECWQLDDETVDCVDSPQVPCDAADYPRCLASGNIQTCTMGLAGGRVTTVYCSPPSSCGCPDGDRDAGRD
jgi:hypothetical protein